MKIIIIGGVAGGASTAARLRRLDESIEILMVERGRDISFANCGIPYFIGGVIPNRSQLTLISPAQFRKMFHVDVRTQTEAIAIDRVAKTVTLKNLSTHTIYTETYDKLVLSPGANPIKPPIPGIEDPRIFTVRTLDDADVIKAYIKKHSVQKAAVIGGGFIGIEMVENLRHLGISVSLIEQVNQVLTVLDNEMAEQVHRQLRNQQIDLILADGISQFISTPNDVEVLLNSKRSVAVDMVILAIGIKPEIGLAKSAGLAIGETGGIIVNAYQQTQDPNIYALGDAAEIIDWVNKKPRVIPLANSANKQGRLIANHICGNATAYLGTPGTAILKVFDLTVAITGNNEKQLQKDHQNYQTVFLTPASHASYYPDATWMLFKLLYAPADGRILGAQIVGTEGVDKRIDVISAMLQTEKTIYDLAKLELAYAPPYSSAKDPINLAGMIAINQLENRNPPVSIADLPKWQNEGAFIVDVRDSFEFESGHIAGAKNIPLTQIRDRIAEFPKDKKIIVYCNQGKTAYFAISILKNLGFQNVYNLNGGYTIYQLTSI